MFSIIGDSNIKRHLNQMNRRVRPAMETAELKHCGRLDIFEESIRSLHQGTVNCILSCITNFLTMTEGDSSSAAVRVEPVLTEVRELLTGFCQEFPERNWFLAPPMYRTSPVWYLDGLPEILVKFSKVFSEGKPGNLILMPSFPNPTLEADGVHLTPYSGFEFVVSLFDSADELLSNLRKTPTCLARQQTEAIRCLEDRMTYVEQDHKRLNKSVESKNAANAEAWDFDQNQRYDLLRYLNMS